MLKIKNETNYIKDSNFLIVNKLGKNLGSHLILNFKLKNHIKFFTNKCNLNNCMICKFTSKTFY